MRAHEFINEIEMGGGLDDDVLNDIKDANDYTNQQTDLFPDIPTLDPKVPSDMKIVGRLGAYRVVYSKIKPGDNEDAYYRSRYDHGYSDQWVLFDKNNPIAIVLTMSKLAKPNFIHEYLSGKIAKVKSVYVDEKYRGKGLAKDMYGWLLENKFDVLLADDLQTRQGAALWDKIRKDRRFVVEVFNDSEIDSRKRTGKDWMKIYDYDHLHPWVTLKSKYDQVNRSPED